MVIFLHCTDWFAAPGFYALGRNTDRGIPVTQESSVALYVAPGRALALATGRSIETESNGLRILTAKTRSARSIEYFRTRVYAGYLIFNLRLSNSEWFVFSANSTGLTGFSGLTGFFVYPNVVKVDAPSRRVSKKPRSRRFRLKAARRRFYLNQIT